MIKSDSQSFESSSDGMSTFIVYCETFAKAKIKLSRIQAKYNPTTHVQFCQTLYTYIESHKRASGQDPDCKEKKGTSLLNKSK